MAGKKKYRTFTPEENDFIRELTLSGHSLKDTAEIFSSRYSPPITVTQVKSWRANHHTVSGVTGHFEKGNVPWNKGKHTLSSGNSPLTQHQLHNRPWNSKNVGDIVTINDKSRRLYKKIKVAEPNVWKLLHVKVWEDHNGPLPKGSMIRFYDMDTMNCDIKNLYCVTKGENATMNHLKLYPANEEELQTARLICRLSSLKSKRRHKKKGDA